MPPPCQHNLCSQIENSFRRGFTRIALRETHVARQIAHILYDEGFVSAVASGDIRGPFRAGFEVPPTPDSVSGRRIWLSLKYRDGEPALRKCRAVSLPSRRVFATNQELRAVASARRLQNNLIKPQEVGQIMVLRTPHGVIELKEALRLNVGGEVLFTAA